MEDPWRHGTDTVLSIASIIATTHYNTIYVKRSGFKTFTINAVAPPVINPYAVVGIPTYGVVANSGKPKTSNYDDESISPTSKTSVDEDEIELHKKKR